ncbi:hypothetical protein [Serratia fonticola]|uniref:hypothetical protein n=1 Tax=Serratia fonticola TaxID=47917 RepID=UPI000B0145D9|nr:hypothetical protein [Serratia fonticola]
MKFIQWLKGWISSSSPLQFLCVMLGVFFCFVVLISLGDSKEEKEAKATAERTALINAISTASAEKLEAQLKELRANEIHTEKVIHTETIKPVFSNVCATDEYVRLLNQSIDRAERTLSGQSDGKVPGDPAAPGG